MPDLQPTETSAATAVPALFDAPASEDLDYAFGCECADPSLQIERWNEPGAVDAS